MRSANYVFGSGFSIDGFNEYIMPSLKERGISVPDIMSVPSENGRAVLTTLVGDISEEEIKDILNRAYERADGQYRTSKARGEEPKNPFGMHPSYMKRIGDYNEESAGSRLFASLALDFFLDSHGEMADEIEEKIRGLLEKKLSEFCEL